MKKRNLVTRMRVTKLARDLKLDHQVKDRLENKMGDRTYLWLYLDDDIYETFRDSI